MLLSGLIFTFYLVLFCWLITTIPFFRRSGLSKHWLIILFIIKILAGAGYAWFYLQPGNYETSDTWRYFKLSLEETDWLMRDPAGFFSDLFHNGYAASGGLFAGEDSYWNDLKTNMIIKLLAICNLFSFKNYFTNIILFNFLFFFGPVALYRLVRQKLRSQTPKPVLIAVIFLIPSFLFWCSGVHKDGLIFSCLTLILYLSQEMYQQRKISFGKIVLAALLLLLLFSFRNFMAILLLPAILVWILILRFPKKAVLMAVSIYGTGILIFFLSPLIGLPDFPAFIVEKQNEFKQLEGTSQIAVPELENNVRSFLEFLPSAIDIGFLRPHPTEIDNKSYLPAVAENLMLTLIAIFFLLKTRQSTPKDLAAFNWFCLCFAISFLILAGYTVTFTGAIVRYRAVVLPLLFLPLVNGVSFPQHIFGKGID